MPVKYLPATEVKNRFGRVLREVARTGGGLEEAAFGMWAGRDDIGDEWLAEGRKRWESDWKREQTD